MEEAKTELRVVPSGKVYRQKFDAEVQLVRAYTETEEKRRSRNNTSLLQPKEPTAIPLVRMSRQATGTGMLTGRQRTWVEGFSNESAQENPVLYKFYSEQQPQQEQEPEDSEGLEVRGLPDVIVPTKTGSDIIERIAESRRQRHDTALEEMHQELGLISAELEVLVSYAGKELLARLAENDKEVETSMATLTGDDQLMALTKPQLEQLWVAVADQSVVRQYWVRQLDERLSAVEQERMQRVRQVFLRTSDTLQSTAHLAAPDLARLLDTEAQLINQTILSNRRAYADLHARLMMADIEREKRLHTQWRRRVDDWRKLHTERACKQFMEHMESRELLEPERAAAILEKMKCEQEALNERRLALVSTIRTFKPPASTKTAVYQWNQQLTEVSKQIDKLNQEHFQELYKEYEKVCQSCLQQVEAVKEDLVSRGVCSPSRAQAVVQERCLPLVGARQTAFEKQLEVMDKTLEQHNSQVLSRLRSLFKYVQGAAHVWDVHELGLARTERALQERLDGARRKHDTENQDKEANLDIIMDRMRQDASEVALQDSLTKALNMLDSIKAGYEEFHTEQTSIVQSYPEMVEEELTRYDGSVCTFFTLSRHRPGEEGEVKVEEKPPSPPPKVKAGKKKGKVSPRPPSVTQATGPVSQTVIEVISSANGTTFYVLSVAGEHGPTEGGQTARSEDGTTFLTTGAEEDDKLPDYVRNVDVGGGLLSDIKKQVRLNFVNFLEEWSAQALERAGSVVAAKCEELNSELELRLHLHAPRARRAQLDVHNVRAAELVMHSERVTRHCKGVTQAVAELKQRFSQMSLEHNKLTQKFRKDIEALETVFIGATKSSKLVALSGQLQSEQDTYMDVIRASLRTFRQHLDDTLGLLRQSNATFIKSFKVFSDGGNFCPEEIDEYRKRLEKMAHKIDSAEGFIMADLEGMESKRLDQAAKIASEFQDRFKHHMVDLVFMEKIARWLTNTQVKIKAEVADSNAQAQRLAQHLSELERRTDACVRPNLDKESVTPQQLYESVQPILEAFQERSVYLNCLKQPLPKPGTPIMQGPPAAELRISFGMVVKTMQMVAKAKVGFAAGAADVGPVQRGKHTPEDPSVAVIKNILKTQKSRLGLEVEEAEEERKKPVRRITTTILQVADPPEHESGEGGTTGAGGNAKSRMSHRSDAKSHVSKKSARSSTTTDAPKRAQSGTTRSMFSKGKGIDKKYFVFGESAEEGEAGHFLGRVRRLLRTALDGLLAASEMYYRQKGSRAVTRPQALQESFEQCADTILQKLQSYYKQADDYHNECLQELRRRLDNLEDSLRAVPGCVLRELLQQCQQQAREEREALDRQFSDQLNKWAQEKAEHSTKLRPDLGHPNASEQLKALTEQEGARRQAYLAGVEQHAKTLQECAGRLGQEFVQRLAELGQRMLLDFDSLLTIDDVEKGRVAAAKHATAELQRRKNAGQPLEDGEPPEKVPRGSKTWPGVPRTELVNPNAETSRAEQIKEKAARRGRDGKKREVPSSLTASVTTAKNSLPHGATQEARDRVYQEYKAFFAATLRGIEEQKESQLIAEQRWTDSWKASVSKVTELY